MAKTRVARLARFLQSNSDLTYQRAFAWVEAHQKFDTNDELLAAFLAEQGEDGDR